MAMRHEDDDDKGLTSGIECSKVSRHFGIAQVASAFARSIERLGNFVARVLRLPVFRPML